MVIAIAKRPHRFLKLPSSSSFSAVLIAIAIVIAEQAIAIVKSSDSFSIAAALRSFAVPWLTTDRNLNSLHSGWRREASTDPSLSSHKYQGVVVFVRNSLSVSIIAATVIATLTTIVDFKYLVLFKHNEMMTFAVINWGNNLSFTGLQIHHTLY